MPSLFVHCYFPAVHGDTPRTIYPIERFSKEFKRRAKLMKHAGGFCGGAEISSGEAHTCARLEERTVRAARLQDRRAVRSLTCVGAITVRVVERQRGRGQGDSNFSAEDTER